MSDPTPEDVGMFHMISIQGHGDYVRFSDYEAERLAMLAEECGEVIQIVGKILRHGYDSYHPDNPLVTNRQLLGRELTDLYAVASALCRDKVPEGSLHDQDRAWDKKLRYAHHQEEVATRPGASHDQ